MINQPQSQVYHEHHTYNSSHILSPESLCWFQGTILHMSLYKHVLPLTWNKPEIGKTAYLYFHDSKSILSPWLDKTNTFSRGPARRKWTPLGLPFWTTIWRKNMVSSKGGTQKDKHKRNKKQKSPTFCATTSSGLTKFFLTNRKF